MFFINRKTKDWFYVFSKAIGVFLPIEISPAIENMVNIFSLFIRILKIVFIKDSESSMTPTADESRSTHLSPLAAVSRQLM
jgi:hypothetical protein